MKIFAIILMLILSISDCARGPHDQYLYMYPCFLDNTHYAYVCFYSNVSNGIWGDPNWGASKSIVTVVDMVKNDSMVIYEDSKFRNINYLSFNYSGSTLTVATSDSLLVYDKAGKRLSSYYSKNADHFAGWYKPDSQFLSNDGYSSIQVRNVRNNSVSLPFIACCGDAQTGKIVVARNDSLFAYPLSIFLKTPLEPEAVRWVNDSIVAFCGEHTTGIWIHNLNANTTSFTTDAHVDYLEPTFSISPDLKWVIYGEDYAEEDITPLVIKEIAFNKINN